MPNGSGPAPAKVTEVANDKLVKALQLAGGDTPRAWAILIDGLKLSEEAVANAFVKWARTGKEEISRFDPAAGPPEPDAVKLIPVEVARRYLLVPLKVERDRLTVAMANPADLLLKDRIGHVTKKKLRVLGATRTEVEDAINKAYLAPPVPIPPTPSPAVDSLDEILRDIPEASDFKVVSEVPQQEAGSAQAAPVVKLVNRLVSDSIRDRASDIHLEPRVNGLQVRVRIDGVMREVALLPRKTCQPVVSRIKVLCNPELDITETRLPQDSRFRVVDSGREVDLRVSILPTYLGEKAVMRILGGGRIPEITKLGFEPGDLEALLLQASKPQGIILVTGPTGSGKTTSLYSLLNHRLSPEVNIITVEDPVEFQLAGTNQVQVNVKAGLTFSVILRACLRQDPDIILVGEIRDRETAEIAFHASQTGHLVLSTLHTNSAPATVSRLLDLGIDPRVVSSSVLLVMAQRLARKICSQCKSPYQPPESVLKRLRLPADGAYCRGPGCAACDYSGFSGRTGIYELLVMTRAVREVINQRQPETEIREAARAGGYSPLLEKGLAKVRAGLTTPEELLRVLQVEEEGGEAAEAGGSAASPAFAESTAIVAMLFAEAANFGKPTDQQASLFVRHFLGAIGELAGRSSAAPVMAKSREDGLHFVFSSARAAGCFALELCHQVTHTNWAERELPKDLGLRIGLHAGLAHKCKNPVTGLPDYIHMHTSGTVRMEPNTPPGQVYATEPFAALAASERVTDFVCEQVAETPFFQGLAASPTYLVRRRA